MDKLVIAVLGRDRPGILAAASRVLVEQNCNIEDVSQTILQALFGALFVVSVADGTDPEELRARLLSGVRDFNLEVYVSPYSGGGQANAIAGLPYVVTALGPDRHGLVAAIAAVLAGGAINITNLKAVFKGGDDPRDNIMIFEVDVPAGSDLRVLRARLQEVAHSLHLEINLQHRAIFERMNRI
ncbi:MAG: ACT domain-containing protein [Gammaproteobacteria bacterium]|nr:ACT domain-containing protein [Gammaproteobacteria bacterium]